MNHHRLGLVLVAVFLCGVASQPAYADYFDEEMLCFGLSVGERCEGTLYTDTGEEQIVGICERTTCSGYRTVGDSDEEVWVERSCTACVEQIGSDDGCACTSNRSASDLYPWISLTSGLLLSLFLVVRRRGAQGRGFR